MHCQQSIIFHFFFKGCFYAINGGIVRFGQSFCGFMSYQDLKFYNIKYHTSCSPYYYLLAQSIHQL